MNCPLLTTSVVVIVGPNAIAFPAQLTAMRNAGRDQQTAPTTRTDAQRAPSLPPATRGRPTAHLHCTRPAQLVAALKARAAHPRGSGFRLVRVTPVACRTLRASERIAGHAAIVAPRTSRKPDPSHPKTRCSRPTMVTPDAGALRYVSTPDARRVGGACGSADMRTATNHLRYNETNSLLCKRLHLECCRGEAGRSNLGSGSLRQMGSDSSRCDRGSCFRCIRSWLFEPLVLFQDSWGVVAGSRTHTRRNLVRECR